MKITIIGAGALGSLFGGLLAKSGEEVWLFDPIAGEHIAKINARGLIIEGEDGEERIRVKGTTKIEEIGKAELVALFTKACHIEKALKGALPAIGGSTSILSLQNGLGIVEIMEEYVSQAQLLRGVTSQGSTFLGPGRIRHAGRGPTQIGQVSRKADSAKLEQTARVFNAAGLETHVETDIKGLVWSKLLVNVGINALTAIFNVPNGELVRDSELHLIMHGVVGEAVEVAHALGLDFGSEETIRRVEEVCRNTARNISSMLQDVRRGSSTEIDYINGAIVRQGERLGLDTPLNRLLTRLVKEKES